MTYQGHVENGKVVFDSPAGIPDGTKVTVYLANFEQEDLPNDNEGLSLYERLMPLVGAATGLPPDASKNVDHYLYGAPRA